MDTTYDVPIVLFVFKRLETVQMIVEQIRKARPKTIYVFADGARPDVSGEEENVSEVRNYIENAIDWDCDKRIFFSKTNKGCDKNIRDGLDRVFSEQPRAVVFEDDAVPITEFFQYCNELLDKYENDKRIQYIAGFNAIGDNEIIKDDYTFGQTAPMSGAFATWADRWNNCDFELKDWPDNKKTGRFNDIYYSKEMRIKAYKSFDDVYNKISTAWDYMFEHDMLNKNRLVVVPKGNLATSYGFAQGAYHPQEKKEAVRVLRMMTRTNEQISFPLNGPDIIKRNPEYDEERQRKLLAVKGNYIVRLCRNIYLSIKEWFYKNLPTEVWNSIKKIVKR